MPLAPLTVTLSDGQKIAALKRFRELYQDELTKIEAELTDILTASAEADFLVPYLGEQTEVSKLRERRKEADVLERRRQHVGALIDRLDQVIPKQADAKYSLGGAAPKPGAAPAGSGLRKY